jgi:hypothetical protein
MSKKISNSKTGVSKKSIGSNKQKIKQTNNQIPLRSAVWHPMARISERIKEINCVT